MILIGIFAITAGIISATTLATPAAREGAGRLDRDHGVAGAIHIAHLGGDPLPPESALVRGTTSDGTTETLRRSTSGSTVFGRSALNNGFSEVSDRRLGRTRPDLGAAAAASR